MPKFKVQMQQYVEQLATIEIEAEDEKTARDIAKQIAFQAVWTDGDDSYEVDVYAVEDDQGRVVWERS